MHCYGRGVFGQRAVRDGPRAQVSTTNGSVRVAELRTGANRIRDFFGGGYDREVQVAMRADGGDRGVDDTKPLDAVDAAMLVDHRQGVAGWPHQVLTGAGGIGDEENAERAHMIRRSMGGRIRIDGELYVPAQKVISAVSDSSPQSVNNRYVRPFSTITRSSVPRYDRQERWNWRIPRCESRTTEFGFSSSGGQLAGSLP